MLKEPFPAPVGVREPLPVVEGTVDLPRDPFVPDPGERKERRLDHGPVGVRPPRPHRPGRDDRR